MVALWRHGPLQAVYICLCIACVAVGVLPLTAICTLFAMCFGVLAVDQHLRLKGRVSLSKVRHC